MKYSKERTGQKAKIKHVEVRRRKIKALMRHQNNYAKENCKAYSKTKFCIIITIHT